MESPVLDDCRVTSQVGDGTGPSCTKLRHTSQPPGRGDPDREATRRVRTGLRPVVIGSAWPLLRGAAFFMLFLGLLWRTVRYAMAFPLWGDEAYVAVNLLTRDLAGLAQPLEYFQIVPPGFLWVEWLVVHAFGSGEWALRLVPYLAGVGGLLGFWSFCGKVTTRRTTLIATAILAASFYPVRHSIEVKPYAIDLLVSLALTSVGWWVWRDVRSYRRWMALLALAAVGVWCSYTAVFPGAGVALLLGARVVRERSSRLMAVWLLLGISMVLSWAVMYVGFAGPQAHDAAFLPNLATWRNAFPPLAQPWRLPWWLLEIHTGQMLAYPHGGHDFGSTFTAFLVVMGCVRMAQRRARRPLLFLLLAPLPFALVAAAMHRYPYGTSTRVMLYMAPAFCLLAGEGTIAFLRARHAIRRGPLIVAGVLAALPLAAMAFDVARPYRSSATEEHRRLARWIAGRVGPADQLIVFNSVTPPPVFDDLMLTQWLQRVAEVRFYLLSYSPVPVRWEPEPETIVSSPPGKVWLIVQRHGDIRHFSEEKRAAYQQAVERRLGPLVPTSRFDLPNDESWSIFMESPSPRDGTVAAMSRLQGPAR